MPPATARRLLADHLRHPPPPDLLPQILLSIKPHYAHLIQQGTKTTEFRRRFPRNITRARAIFYVTAPTQAITLTATIAGVVRAPPGQLWQRFADTSGTDEQSFHHYFSDLPIGVALLLQGVRRLDPPIHVTDPRLVGFRPPQSLTLPHSSSPLARLLP